MMSNTRQSWLRDAMADPLGFWRRARTIVLVGIVAALLIGAAVAASFWGVGVARNLEIEALIHNHDVKVAADSAPRVAFARAYFLMTHGDLDQAQARVSLFDLRGSPRQRSDLHYDMANARLRRAFDMISGGDIAGATALVELSREDYREALRLDPENWNARFNFDVASRLVREYPTFELPPELRGRSQRGLWTELPSVPQGEP